MGHLWNESQVDLGIDGHVELVDLSRGAATGRLIAVQSKATSVPFSGLPVYICREDDLRYWLNGNAPVILIRSHPPSGQAYWVAVKEYFAKHPEHRRARRIQFGSEDLFDRSCADRLWQLGRPRDDGLHLGTPPAAETLSGNLLELIGYPPGIFASPTRSTSYLELGRRMRDQPGAWSRAWAYSAGSVYSFDNPADGPAGALCDGPPSASIALSGLSPTTRSCAGISCASWTALWAIRCGQRCGLPGARPT